MQSQPIVCDLFGDDFNVGILQGWTLANGTWQVINQQFQLKAPTPGSVAIARHALSAPNVFDLSVDVEFIKVDDGFYGLLPFSTTQTFELQLTAGTRRIDGLGAVVFRDPTDGILKAGFPALDLDTNTLFSMNMVDYGPVESLGIIWYADGVTLAVNGEPRFNAPPAAFGHCAWPRSKWQDSASLVMKWVPSHSMATARRGKRETIPVRVILRSHWAMSS